MRNRRRLEAACGLLAALFGFLGIAYAIFGPTFSFQSSSGYTGTANMVQMGLPPSILIANGILVLVPIAVAVSTVLHSLTGCREWRGGGLGGPPLLFFLSVLCSLPVLPLPTSLFFVVVV